MSEAIPLHLADTLHSHMKEVINEMDRLIDYVADGTPAVYASEVILDNQAWGIALTDKAKISPPRTGALLKQLADMWIGLSPTILGRSVLTLSHPGVDAYLHFRARRTNTRRSGGT